MVEKYGICPFCGGWLISLSDSSELLVCDTCNAEWQDDELIRAGDVV